MTLPDRLYAEVTSRSKRGDQLAAAGRYAEALTDYHTAFRLLPEPKEDWEAATWLLATIGDAYYFTNDFKAALDALSWAMHCPDAIGNPFLHLRLGQCALILGDEAKAADELTRAYAMGGVEIFATEDPRFLEFLGTKIQR